jgi:hypothetical protein
VPWPSPRRRIAFGTGRADLRSTETARLLAHEAAHATLHPKRSESGRRLVHARLGGSAGVSEAMGGGTKPARVCRLRQRGVQLLSGMDDFVSAERKCRTL